MRIRKLIPVIGATVAVLATSIPAQAALPGFYVGGSWGAYRMNEGDLDDHDKLLKGYVGAQFNEWFAVEGVWTDFNRIDNPDGDRFEGDGKGLSGLLTIPLGTGSAVFARAGEFWWDADTSFGGIFGGGTGRTPFYGAGFQFGFNDHIALRIEAERYDIAEVDLDTATVGLQFKF